jgi:hypothetical protein
MSKDKYTVNPLHVNPLSKAQQTMAREMEEANVTKAGKVIDDVLGSAMTSDPEALRLTLAIIDRQEGIGLQFSMRQWALIQNMIEQGVRAGRNHLIAELDGDAGKLDRW